MSSLTRRLLVVMMMFALSFSILACASAPHIGVGHMHHSTQAFAEHLTHAYSLTLATMSAISIITLAGLAVVLAWFLNEVPLPRSLVVLPIPRDPPRKKKLRRTLFSLRSPPTHSI